MLWRAVVAEESVALEAEGAAGASVVPAVEAESAADAADVELVADTDVEGLSGACVEAVEAKAAADSLWVYVRFIWKLAICAGSAPT